MVPRPPGLPAFPVVPAVPTRGPRRSRPPPSPAAAPAARRPPSTAPLTTLMSPTNARRMVYVAWALAALAAGAAVFDLVGPEGSKIFGGQTVMDILLLVAAALVGYLGFDAYKDIR